MIRFAVKKDITKIKKLVDSVEEMDVTENTFTKDYYSRLIDEGILLVAEKFENIIGVCFGKYNKKEKWADLLGVVVSPQFRNKGIGNSLVNEFENFVRRNKIKTIDLYAEKNKQEFYKNLGYKRGRVYISFRKEFNY